MNISKDTWHFKVFNFWFEQKHGMSIQRRTDYYGKAPSFNLCPYVRAILFWAPARYLFSPPRIWATLSGILIGSLSVLYHFRGLHGLFVFWQAVLGVIGVISGVIGTVWLFEKIKDFYKGHRIDAMENFTEILKERAKAAHDGVCPIIEFKS